MLPTVFNKSGKHGSIKQQWYDHFPPMLQAIKKIASKTF